MNCHQCQKPFTARRTTKKYCSATCKQYAYLNRNDIDPNAGLKGIQPTFKEKPVQQVITVQEKQTVHGNIEDLDHWPDIFHQLREELEPISEYYFSTSKTGRIKAENSQAFVFVCPRILCIVDNLFYLSYKKEVNFNTLYVLLNALNDLLSSAEYLSMPSDFPFNKDLVNLFHELKSMCISLKESKQGSKLILSKEKIVRYVLISHLIGQNCKRQSFSLLFPTLVS